MARDIRCSRTSVEASGSGVSLVQEKSGESCAICFRSRDHRCREAGLIDNARLWMKNEWRIARPAASSVRDIELATPLVEISRRSHSGYGSPWLVRVESSGQCACERARGAAHRYSVTGRDGCSEPLEPRYFRACSHAQSDAMHDCIRNQADRPQLPQQRSQTELRSTEMRADGNAAGTHVP